MEYLGYTIQVQEMGQGWATFHPAYRAIIDGKEAPFRLGEYFREPGDAIARSRRMIECWVVQDLSMDYLNQPTGMRDRHALRGISDELS